MKTKGITIWERHLEKMVLGVAAAAAVAFTAMQFIGQPNAVTTSVGSVTPRDVDKLLQQRAEQLLSKLGDDAAPGMELQDPKPALDDLRTQRTRPLSPQPTLALYDVAVLPEFSGESQPVGKATYPVPALSAPVEVSVRQFTDTLVDGVFEQHAELQKVLAVAGAPHDLTFTTVRATVDLAALRKQFRREEGAARSAIPTTWYNDHPENMVDVVVEREELVAGNWTNATVLDPIPGQTTVRPQLVEIIDSPMRDEILGWLADPAYQLAVIQPDFYALRNGDWDAGWTDGPAAKQGADNVATLRARLKKLLSDRDRLLEELARLGGKMDDDKKGGGGAPGAPKGPGAGGGGPGEGGGGPSSGGGGGRRSGGSGGPRDAPGKGKGSGGFESGGEQGKGPTGGKGPDKDDDPKVKQIKINALKGKIRALDVRVDRAKDELRGLGIDVDKEEGPAAVDPFADLKGDTIQVWAHDITVLPDRTYRYHLKLRVYNPFFAKKRFLLTDQEHLADAFCIDTPFSEWSKPVTMSPPLRVFITNATVGGKVIAEVYRFYDGIEWMESFSVASGGAIGGRKLMRRPGDNAQVEIDFTTSLFVLDIVEKISTGRGPADAAGDARVLLHDVRSDKAPELRDPQAELKRPEREALRNKVPPSRPA